MRQPSIIRGFFYRVRRRLIEQLSDSGAGERTAKERSRDRRIRLTACAIIFVVAFGVRLLHWADFYAEIERGTTLLTTFVKPYTQDAEQMAGTLGLVPPTKAGEPADERLLLHPPGYPIVLRALYGDSESVDSYRRLRLLQVLADAGAVVLLFLIAAELIPLGAAIIAGLLAGLSPHLAFYSLCLSPDSLVAFPILAGVYLLARSSKRSSIVLTAAAGAMIGVSCWLRANALLLAPMLALVVLVSFARGKRLKHAAVLLASSLIAISPITIRNWIVYHQFVPVSIGSGITLIEGIADYDEQRRFDMPARDNEVARREAEAYNEPAYKHDLWSLHGIERDRARFAKGVAIIRSEPVWFLGVMLRRAAFMLRYNDSGASNWPLNTRLVPYVSAEAPFRHSTADPSQMQPHWSISPAELLADATISQGTAVTVSENVNSLRFSGGTAGYDNQFISRPVDVAPNTDYLLAFEFNLEEGDAAAKVTSDDARVSLGSSILAVEAAEDRKREKRLRKREGEPTRLDEAARESPSIVIPFASGDRTRVRFVISNNGPVPPSLELRRVEILVAGPTTFVWTHYPRALIRGLQKNLFVTPRMVPLVLIGVSLLAIGRRGRSLAILLAVPLYYLCVQSVLHTEYRYILTIHYFLFAAAAVTIWWAWVWIKHLSGAAVSRYLHKG